MFSSLRLRLRLRVSAALSASCVIGLLAGCGGGASETSETSADGAAVDDSTTSDTSSALSSGLPVGSTLQTVAYLNLRKGPSTSDSVILVIPHGATVTLKAGTPIHGWYYVSYQGHLGYSAGQYLKLASSGSDGGTSAGDGGSGSGTTAAVSRASSWVAVDMPYCGGVNGGGDSICGGTCERTGQADNSAWEQLPLRLLRARLLRLGGSRRRG